MFGLFKRRNRFDDDAKREFVDAIATMLEAQLVPVGNASVEDESGRINPKALGYIYGFVDAALHAVGQDIGDSLIGIPITFQILRKLFPGREERYANYLAEKMGRDQVVTASAMTGGQQFLDFMNNKLAAPMGLARCILES